MQLVRIVRGVSAAALTLCVNSFASADPLRECSIPRTLGTVTGGPLYSRPFSASNAQLREATIQWRRLLELKGQPVESADCHDVQQKPPLPADEHAFRTYFTQNWTPTLSRSPAQSSSSCTPRRSSVAPYALRCTGRNETEYGYCEAIYTMPPGSRNEYFYSSVFKTTWIGNVNSNSSLAAKKKALYKEEVEDNFPNSDKVGTSVFCDWGVSAAVATELREARKGAAANNRQNPNLIVQTALEP